MADAAHQNELELNTQTNDLFEKNVVEPQTDATPESIQDDQPIMSKIEARLAQTRAKIEAARQKRQENLQGRLDERTPQPALEIEQENHQKESALELEPDISENIEETQKSQTDIETVIKEQPIMTEQAPSQMEAQLVAQQESEKKAKKGRPRSKKSKNAILKATNTLLLRTSVQELSIEAIAKKAKVGKTTIYRWWPNKTAVVMDALKNQPGIQSHLPTPKNNTDALIMQLDKLIRMLDGVNGDTIAQLFSEAQASDKARKIFAANFITPLLDAIQYSIEEGQKAGEFKINLDTKLTADMLVGPIFFRQMTRPEEIGDNFRETYPLEAMRLISA